MARFARDVLGEPLFPWQEWLVIHAGELDDEGLPRFRQVLVLVARQNGKTHLLKVLALYWLYVEGVNLVLGTSTNLDYAREAWEKTVDLAEAVPLLAAEVPRNGIRRANGEQTLKLTTGGRYKIAASNRKGGRSLTVDRLIMDELREHHDWSAYSAAVPATSAVPDAQVWMITNAGDDKSIVLNSLRDQALAGADPRLGIFEWSAPDGAEATDLEALAQANPALGLRIRPDALLGDAVRSQAAGGEQLAMFLTESQCRRVPLINAAIDVAAWEACYDYGPITGKTAWCLDVSVDQRHATIYAASVEDSGTVRLDVVDSWAGVDATADMQRDLPAKVAANRPEVLGWFPGGPAAALATELRAHANWPPEGVALHEIGGTEAATACMSFAQLVLTQALAHSNDPLLNTHIRNAERAARGDSWRFVRRNNAEIDALYAAAGAAYLARLDASGQIDRPKQAAFSLFVPS